MLFLFSPFCLKSQDIDVVRMLYLDAGEDRNNIGAFVNFFKNPYPKENTLFIAYHGTALAMKADLEKGNWNKYKVFVEGKNLVELAISCNPRNFEMRYLRFAIQSNIPGFLGYNNIKEDAEFLVKNINSIATVNNKELHDVILITLLDSNKLTNTEKHTIRKYKTKLNQHFEHLPGN